MEKLTEFEIRENINFIDNTDKIEEIFGGFSEAYTYKIDKNGKFYFLKILRNRDNAVYRIHEILDAYHQAKIDTVNLVECDTIKKFDMYYCIYDWINGIPLANRITEKKSDYFFDIGKQIGKKLANLKKLPFDIKYIKKEENLLTKIHDWLKLMKMVPDEIVYKYFSLEEVEDIKFKMIEYAKYFNEEDKCLIHSDIKLGNIMISDEKIYIIDIEDMQYDYDIFNIISWPIGVFEKNIRGECDKAFQKGLFYEISQNRKNFDKQLLFVYMVKFCFDVYRRFTLNKDLEQLELYKIAYDETNQFTKL